MICYSFLSPATLKFYTYLQKILEDIKKDLPQNGSSITWFDVLNRAGVWVDTTSLVIENFE